MKEYSLVAVMSVVLTLLVDRGLGTRITSKKLFWVYLGVMFCFKILVNGYLTWRPIVLYGDRYFSTVRLATIPIEDFMYGFSLVTLSVIFWEYFSGKEQRKKEFSGGRGS